MGKEMGRLLLKIWSWLPPIKRSCRSLLQRLNKNYFRPFRRPIWLPRTQIWR